MPDANWWGYRIRAELAAPFLRGRGLEIGAGGAPQVVPQGATVSYYDKSDSAFLAKQFDTEITYTVHPVEQIARDFPSGADFLIAHNVLEHTPDPIGTLMRWNSFVQNKGVVVLSMPNKDFTEGDKRRATVTKEHLIHDHIFGRDEFSFESLEHNFGFMLNWDYARWTDTWRDLTRDQLVDAFLHAPYAKMHDFHFHAADRAGWDFVLGVAAVLGGRSLELLEFVDPASKGKWVPQGEVIYIYRLRKGDKIKGISNPRRWLANYRRTLLHAALRLPEG
jgi:SAM-dependent methyltransferase